MSSNQPISEQYRVAADAFVDADSAATLLEELKSAFQAQEQLRYGNIPVNKAEQTVKASRSWDDYVRKMVEARAKANKLKVQVEYLRMKFSEQQSAEANARAERRM